MKQINAILVYHRGKLWFAKYSSEPGWHLHTAATTTLTAVAAAPVSALLEPCRLNSSSTAVGWCEDSNETLG